MDDPLGGPTSLKSEALYGYHVIAFLAAATSRGARISPGDREELRQLKAHRKREASLQAVKKPRTLWRNPPCLSVGPEGDTRVPVASAAA